ncbi:hypothetical protein N7U49_08180 [Streptomyces sp. AD2-2]|nr:hypothetical protein N7U49_08180 [Streptomyces sp. AD2-2]
MGLDPLRVEPLGPVIAVHDGPGLVLLALAGAAVAAWARCSPAGWAARIRTATALRA